MRRRNIAVALVLLTGCTSGEAAISTTSDNQTTVAIAAPTPPPTTAAPPATNPPPTTKPPTTTVAATPAELAEAEIKATLDAFYTDLDACYAAPDSCDIDALLEGYFAPGDSVPRNVYFGIWQELRESEERKVVDGRFERTFPWITGDAQGASGTSFMCEVNSSFDVPLDAPKTAHSSPPPDLTVGYVRVYFEWQRQPDGAWLVTHGEGDAGYAPDEVEPDDLPSLTEEEISQCF